MKKLIVVIVAMLSLAAITFAPTANAAVTDGMAANDVLGQVVDEDGDYVPSFTQGTSNSGLGSVNAYGFNESWDVVLDPVLHRLFVAERANNRVMVHQLDASNQIIDYEADFVIGQSNFSLSNAATTQSGLQGATGLAVDSEARLLYVSNQYANRVTVYDLDSVSNGMNASYVLGQSSYTTGTGANTASGLREPIGVTIDADRKLLYVSDYANYRIMVFDVDSITNGENAVHVLGAPDFTTRSTTPTSASKVSTISDVEIDTVNQRLFAVVSTQNRILVFDVDEISDGEAAVNVLGQSLFTTAGTAFNASGFNNPWGATYSKTDDLLFVADLSSNRVTIFDVAVITDGEAAVNVLGQTDFTGTNTGTTDSTFSYPIAIALVPETGTLYVSEYSNNRVTIFGGISTPTITTTTTTTTTTLPEETTTTAPGGEGPNNGDANNDGIPDSEQPYVSTLVNSVLGVDGGYVVLVAPNTCTNESLAIKSKSDVGVPDEMNYPAGLLDFTIDCVTPGVSVTIEQYYYGLNYKAADFIGRKYTPYNGVVQTLTGSSVSDEVIDGQHVVKLTYSLTDGGQLDNDQLANGSIVDPAGLGTALTEGSLAETGSDAVYVVTAATLILMAGAGFILASKKKQKI